MENHASGRCGICNKSVHIPNGLLSLRDKINTDIQHLTKDLWKAADNVRIADKRLCDNNELFHGPLHELGIMMSSFPFQHYYGPSIDAVFCADCRDLYAETLPHNIRDIYLKKLKDELETVKTFSATGNYLSSWRILSPLKKTYVSMVIDIAAEFIKKAELLISDVEKMRFGHTMIISSLEYKNQDGNDLLHSLRLNVRNHNLDEFLFFKDPGRPLPSPRELFHMAPEDERGVHYECNPFRHEIPENPTRIMSYYYGGVGPEPDNGVYICALGFFWKGGDAFSQRYWTDCKEACKAYEENHGSVNKKTPSADSGGIKRSIIDVFLLGRKK